MSTSPRKIYPTHRFVGLQKAVAPNTLGALFVGILGGPYINVGEHGKRVGLTEQQARNFVHNNWYPTEAIWNEVRSKLIETFAEGWAKDGAGDRLDQGMRKIFAARKQNEAESQKEAAKKAAATPSKGTKDWYASSSLFARKFVTGKWLTAEVIASRSPEGSPVRNPDLIRKIMTNDPAVSAKDRAAVVEELCRQHKLKDNLEELDSYQKAQRLIGHLRKMATDQVKPA